MKGLGVVGEKSYAFAIRIVNAYKILCRNNEFVLSKQLLRSGTAIGAFYVAKRNMRKVKPIF